MLKNVLATTAFASILATGAFAQMTTEPAPGDPLVAPETAPAIDAPATAPIDGGAPVVTGDAMDGVGGTAYMPVDIAGVSADELIGADIRNNLDESIATVHDVVLAGDGSIDGVVARFGGFLGFGTNTVLLSLDEVELVTDDSDNLLVSTHLTPEALEGRPEYEAN